jgi:hypothetical protein
VEGRRLRTARNARVIDKHVDAPEYGKHARDRRIDVAFARNVRLQAEQALVERLPLAIAQLLELGVRKIERRHAIALF